MVSSDRFLEMQARAAALQAEYNDSRAATFWLILLPLLVLIGAVVAGAFWLHARGFHAWAIVLALVVSYFLVTGLTNLWTTVPLVKAAMVRFDKAHDAREEFQRELAESNLRQQREREEELPPISALASGDPFAVGGALVREAIVDRAYPAFLAKALTWWREERPHLETYIEANCDSILARADEITDEFQMAENFLNNTAGCRAMATWAVRHKQDDLAHYLEDPADRTIERLTHILQTWAGHEYEILLPRARVLKAARATGSHAPSLSQAENAERALRGKAAELETEFRGVAMSVELVGQFERKLRAWRDEQLAAIADRPEHEIRATRTRYEILINGAVERMRQRLMEQKPPGS